MQIAKKNAPGKNSIVLCDRGIMDCSAYVSEETFLRLLRLSGITSLHEVIDTLYLKALLVTHSILQGQRESIRYCRAFGDGRQREGELLSDTQQRCAE